MFGHMLLVFRLDSIEHQCLDRHCLDSEGKRRL